MVRYHVVPKTGDIDFTIYSKNLTFISQNDPAQPGVRVVQWSHQTMSVLSATPVHF